MNLKNQIARLKLQRDLRTGRCADDEVARAIRSVPRHYAPITADAMSVNVQQFTDGERNKQQNPRGDERLAQSLPPMTELVRLGNSYSAAIPTASRFNSVAAFPTTRAELNIWNGEPDNGKTYVIDTVWALSTVDIAAATSMTVVAQLIAGRQAALTDNTAVLRWSLSGKTTGQASTKSLIALGGTSMVANRWIILGGMATTGAVTIGAGCVCDCYGRIFVPPGSIFGINVIVSTATATTMIMGLTWHEILLTLAQ